MHRSVAVGIGFDHRCDLGAADGALQPREIAGECIEVNMGPCRAQRLEALDGQIELRLQINQFEGSPVALEDLVSEPLETLRRVGHEESIGRPRLRSRSSDRRVLDRQRFCDFGRSDLGRVDELDFLVEQVAQHRLE